MKAIDLWHKPADVEAIRPHIDLMLGTLRPREEDEDIEVRRNAYYLVMSDQPLYAVAAACLQALRGAIGNSGGRFAPQPGELHIAAKKATEALRQERVDIKRILSARVVPDEPPADERAESVARVRAMAAEVRRSAAVEPPHERRKRIKDKWDQRAAERDEARRNRFRSKDEIRVEAQARLDGMTYDQQPVAASASLQAAIARRSV